MKDAFSLVRLSQRVGRLLTERGLTLALAESCTGGLLASVVTDAPGSSAYFLGGVVSYSNQAKNRLLGVREATLVAHGAVSAPTAAEMAQGARRLFESDIALAVTGIAGPGGGTAEKPVGLVFLHLSAPDAEWGEQHIWPHDRLGNKAASVKASLELLTRYLDAGRHATRHKVDVRVERVDQPVLAESHWDGQRWRVGAIWFKGRRHRVIGLGRQNREGQNAWRVMVELEDGARAELLADSMGGGWRLLTLWPSQRVA
ncbi:MAG: CinA family protein [Chloroflexi bacterium]|nr:CinA family protein [Chloroflexota bacterium]